METLHNPYQNGQTTPPNQEGQGQYNPQQGQQYVPQQNTGQYNPQQGQQYVPQPASMPQPAPQQQAPVPPAPQPGQQWSGQQSGAWPQGQPAQQYTRVENTKLGTITGQALQGLNVITIDGYLNNPKLTTTANGFVRLNMFIVWEQPQFDNEGNRRVDPTTGRYETRDMKFMCQAWGNIAQELGNLPVGTPVQITGQLNVWNAERNRNAPAKWVTDIKIISYKQL